MKKKLNNGDLDEKGVDPKYYLFYQIWSELTDEKTLDTYQFKIMNTISALEELEKVLNRRIAGYYSNNKNVEDCMKETCSLVRNDSVLKEYYPVIQTRLLSHLGMKCESDAAQKTLIHRLEYCLKIVREDYFAKLIVSLEKSINDNDVEKIIKKANQLVSRCISRGWSAKALGKIISILNESKNNSDKWESFKNRLLNNNLDEHRIFLPLRIRPRNVAGQRNTDALEDVKRKIRAMDINLVEGLRIAEEYPELGNKVSQEQTYIDLNKKAYDIYTASHKAISEYAKVLNILSFYNLIEAWNIQDISWVVVNVSNGHNVLLKSKDLYSTYDYMEGANGIFRSSRELDRNEEGILKTKLLATYSYANIGKASYSQEDKFINLWVALESLCRTDTVSYTHLDVYKRQIYGCYMKERGKLLNNTVVTTIMSNFGLYKAFDEQGIGYAKTAVGDKYVYEYMAKNGCRIGGEQSGHICLLYTSRQTSDTPYSPCIIVETVSAVPAVLCTHLHRWQTDMATA